jgi:hypothetical protein
LPPDVFRNGPTANVPRQGIPSKAKKSSTFNF